MKFGIIGYGRFGELWGNVLANLDYDVLVYDKKNIQPQHDNIHVVNLETVVNCEFLFLLLPISEIEKVCKEISPLLPEQTVVIDAASVKMYTVSVMRRWLPPHQQIIATHPLFGPDSVARSGLFGHKIVVCPARITESRAKEFEQLLEKLNLEIIYTTPEEHDREMAHSQSLVHFIGRGLGQFDLSENRLSTPDYKSLLRMNSMVVNDSWQLFYDMQKYNPYAKEARLKFLQSLQMLERKIQSNDS